MLRFSSGSELFHFFYPINSSLVEQSVAPGSNRHSTLGGQHFVESAPAHMEPEFVDVPIGEEKLIYKHGT